ncbi:hypothetical protein QO002_005355 [Pararhizobium capsulatum DSM 1112]|uniref:Uncharacterized protein n=1 Tax=Pararhizobium capsulatum DSM 1112 TaxID=1121113 RepID=A0ABU0BY18_9HYPH|nr:hypothetical protein [Pararhizobium capsulatum]MDQ0323149.1 hypothetical protein [Pararhizobium capsulatum DSM 1112]
MGILSGVVDDRKTNVPADFDSPAGTTMEKYEAEKAIRSLSTTWFRTLTDREMDHPSFRSFKDWLRQHGYGHNLDFHSAGGADHDVEVWFNEELRHRWRW